MVGCFQKDVDEPPSIGSIITVKHAGSNEKGRLRNPIFWRERNDIQWSEVTLSQNLSLDEKVTIENN